MTKTIYFYELSNIDQMSYSFSNVDTFYKTCENWGIRLTKANKTYINNHNTVYAICKPGKPELVLSGDYKNLRKNFSKFKK